MVGAVVIVLIVAAVIGAVIWNHKNAGEATAGVDFASSESPSAVAAAIQGIYCGGVKAKAKTLIGGVNVTPLAGSAFHFETKIGDVGRIEVRPGQGSGSVVRASTTDLYVGTPPKSHFRSGIWGLSARMAHGIYKLLGITPNAARMKRFQNGLENRIARHVRKAAA